MADKPQWRKEYWTYRCDMCGRSRSLRAEYFKEEDPFKAEGWIFFTSPKKSIDKSTKDQLYCMAENWTFARRTVHADICTD